MSDTDNNQVGEFLNTLSADAVMDFLARRDIRCPACKKRNWIIYHDGSVPTGMRVLIQCDQTVARLEPNIQMKLHGPAPPIICCTCASCSTTLNLNALVLAKILISEVDANA